MKPLELTGYEKVAVLMLALGKEAAASVMSAMKEDEVVNVARAMSRLAQIDVIEAQRVLDDFVKEMEGGLEKFGGSIEAATDVLGAFLSQDQLKSVVDKIGGSVWSTLVAMEPSSFAKYLSNEHPQAAAFILSKLPPSYMGQVLDYLNKDLADDLIVRISKLPSIAREVEEQIEKCLKVELVGSLSQPSMNKEAAKRFAKMLKGLKQPDREKYIHLLNERNEAFSNLVQEMLVTLEDILLVEPAEFSILLAALETSDLVLALRGASEKVQEYFFANMPKSMSQIIKQEWEMIRKVKQKDIREAEKKIISAMESLVEQEKITLVSDEI